MTAWDFVFVGFLVVVMDLAYWTQACLAASYGVQDRQYNWMEPFRLGFRKPGLIARYVLLLCFGVFLLISGVTSGVFDWAFFAACAFLLSYVVFAGRLFFTVLQKYLAGRN